MAYRTVSREEVRTPEDAQAFVVADTGGACIPTGIVKEVPGGFAVEIYSTDGFSPAPSSPIPCRPGLTDAQIEAQIKQFGDAEGPHWEPGVSTGDGFQKS